MQKILFKSLLIVIGLQATNVHAVYNANASGVVKQVWTYGHVAAVEIDPMPATGCAANDFFYITSGAFSDESYRKFAHGIALTAMVTGKKVNVGYDNQGTGCYGGRPEIYRIDLMNN